MHGISDEEITQYEQQPPPAIDPPKAMQIAQKFLEQYHSTVVFKFLVLEGSVWMVVMDVGLIFEEIRQVAIDANTGKILGYV